MPSLDGIAATQHIFDRCPTPIVILTAYETPELVETASAAGVGAYLVKPLNAREIERAVTVALARFDDLVKLNELNRELHRRNDELDAFAHTVAHDLKDLLARIVGYAAALEEHHGEIPRAEMREYLHTITQNGLKMSGIIDALMLLTGVGEMHVVTGPLDMPSILGEAMDRLAAMAQESEAHIVVPESWPGAVGYGPWIEEVWVNYLSNAIKYGGRPPLVELGADIVDDGNVCFWVRDNGAGIPPGLHSQLFEPFTRVGQDRPNGGGYGLGLSIVKRIVNKLGGEVSVESNLGRGSTFAFTLPAAGDASQGL